MPKAGLFCELSLDADQDIEAIFDYTADEFGVGQAVTYVGGFEAAFERLLDNPELGRDRKDIRSGLRSMVQESHVIFYRILSDRIRIVRILHGSRDLPRFLT